MVSSGLKVLLTIVGSSHGGSDLQAVLRSVEPPLGRLLGSSTTEIVDSPFDAGAVKKRLQPELLAKASEGKLLHAAAEDRRQ
jgi:hypothetical protein